MSRPRRTSFRPLDSDRPTPRAAAEPCEGANLALSYDPAVPFQATGDEGDAFKIINHGPSECRLKGYPKVSLSDHHGALLPFHYTDGQGQYITHRLPQRVILKPAAPAYVGVAKYRCDLGDQILATSITMLLPGDHAAVSVPLTRRARVFSYCRGGPRNPGNLVGISPVEPSGGRTQY